MAFELDRSLSCFICRLTLRPPYIQCTICYHMKLEGPNKDGQVFHHANKEVMPNPLSVEQAEEITLNDEEGMPSLQPVYICAVCFSNGRQLGTHETNHPYIIIRDDFQVFPGSNWSAKEEMCLINAVSAQGIGNWNEVSRLVRSRSARECEKHYQHFYFNGQAFGMPEVINIPEEFSSYAPIKCSDYSIAPRPIIKSNGYSEMAGYMPARADFNSEYDNNAELLVTDIDFDSTYKDMCPAEDQELYNDVALAVVDIYRHRILERVRRKKIIRDYGLINIHATDGYFRSALKCLSAHIVESLRRLMRLMPAEMFIKYVESLKAEVHIRQELKQLEKYRAEGLTRRHHIKIYENLCMRRLETQKRRITFQEADNNMRDKVTWQRWVQQNAISEKISSGSSLPHPALSRRSAPPLQIAGLPGSEKLTDEERELCSTARLLPTAYLDFKTIFINDCEKEGYLRLARARTLIKIDVNKTRKIYDFLIKQNLINKDP